MAAKPVYVRDTLVAINDGTIPGTFNDDRTEFSFPTVKTVSSRGVTLLWTIRVRLLDGLDGTPVPITDDHLGSPVEPLEGLVGETRVEALQEGGKIRESVPTHIDTGKNLGKANATNAITQTFRDALSKYNKQKKMAGPAAEPAAEPAAAAAGPAAAAAPAAISVPRPVPMLVKKEGSTRAATLTEEMFKRGLTGQEKLNGVRLVFCRVPGGATPEERVLFYSRKGDPYPGLNHLRRELDPVLNDPPPITRTWLAEATGRDYDDVSDSEIDSYYVADAADGIRRVAVYGDGELFERGKTLRWISGQARKDTDEGNLSHYTFDVFFPTAKAAGFDLPSAARQEYLDRFFAHECIAKHGPTHFVRVENHPLESREELDEFLSKTVDAGGEGIIVRKDWAGYRYSIGNYHSDNLVKIKSILDSEFPVVGYTEGVGKAKGAVIWIAEVEPEEVVDPFDKTFSVDPKDMTYDERRRIFRCLSELVDPDPDSDSDEPAAGAKLTRFDRDFKGRPLTVEYPERSTKTGKPTQPKALTFRTYEEADGLARDPLKRLYDECD